MWSFVRYDWQTDTGDRLETTRIRLCANRRQSKEPSDVWKVLRRFREAPRTPHTLSAFTRNATPFCDERRLAQIRSESVRYTLR
jgi:hypothetical protein